MPGHNDVELQPEPESRVMVLMAEEALLLQVMLESGCTAEQARAAMLGEVN